jgi:plastocyanin
MRAWVRSIVVMTAVVLPTAGVIWADIGPSHAAENRVDIDDHDAYAGKWKFVPADLGVTRGSSVVWANTSGSYYHTVTSDNGAFDSKHIDSGKEWRWTFTKSGDYAYHCDPHPWMKGVIHVK